MLHWGRASVHPEVHELLLAPRIQAPDVAAALDSVRPVVLAHPGRPSLPLLTFPFRLLHGAELGQDGALAARFLAPGTLAVRQPRLVPLEFKLPPRPSCRVPQAALGQRRLLPQGHDPLLPPLIEGPHLRCDLAVRLLQRPPVVHSLLGEDVFGLGLRICCLRLELLHVVPKVLDVSTDPLLLCSEPGREARHLRLALRKSLR
mmetsp:Transcript_90935/g.294276  ORF Transcript_90935/g.294276 Transcript_90935/m.294276 type:complete len:203 (-) Transcript_90935:715-1323(-)